MPCVGYLRMRRTRLPRNSAENPIIINGREAKWQRRANTESSMPRQTASKAAHPTLTRTGRVSYLIRFHPRSATFHATANLSTQTRLDLLIGWLDALELGVCVQTYTEHTDMPPPCGNAKLNFIVILENLLKWCEINNKLY